MPSPGGAPRYRGSVRSFVADHRHSSGPYDLPIGPRLCRMDRAGTAAKLKGRKDPSRWHLQTPQWQSPASACRRCYGGAVPLQSRAVSMLRTSVEGTLLVKAGADETSQRSKGHGRAVTTIYGRECADIVVLRRPAKFCVK